MHTTPSALLNVRGHFADPALPESDLPEGRTLYAFVDAFPLSDELAVLVFHTGAMLVNVRTQEIFWSIVCCLTSAALDPVQGMLALANGETLCLWDLTIGHMARTWKSESAVTDMAFSPDGKVLATALWEKPDVVLWRVTDGQLVRSLQQQEDVFSCTKSIAWSPNGHLLAMGNYEDHQVWLWDTNDGHLIRKMEAHSEAERINGLTFSPDGSLLIGGEFAGGDVPYTHVWDVHTGQLCEPFPAKSWFPTFHPDGKMLASVSENGIVFWDVASRAPLRECNTLRKRPRRLAFSPGGHTLVTCGDDRAVHWWKSENGLEVYRVEPRFSTRASAAFSADATVLATSTWNGLFRLWNTQTGQLTQTFGLPSLHDEGIAMSADAQFLVSWSQSSIGSGSLHVWQPGSGKRWNLGGAQQWVYQAILSADGQRVAAICGDKKIRLWSLRELPQEMRGLGYIQPIATLGVWTEARAPLAFSPDGHLLATVGDDHAIHLWNTRNHTRIRTLKDKKHTVTSLAFSAKGRLFAAGSAEGRVHVWSVSSGQIQQVCQGMQGKPQSLAFDSTEERLGASSSHGEIHVWHLSNASPVPNGEPDIIETAYALNGNPLLPDSQEERIYLWQLAPNISRYKVAASHTQILHLAFRPDGYLLGAGYGSGSTQIWRVEQITR